MDTADVWIDGAATIPEASSFLKIGRSKLYELISAGRLTTSCIGKRRVVAIRDLKRLLVDGQAGAA